jgi:thiaminase/transcriptional activator TenA
MKVTNLLRQDAHEIWEGNLHHPFVQGIGDGTLDEDRFKFYLIQDFVYLKEYCRFVAVGAAKSDSLESMGQLSDLLQVTLKVEMEVHRSICADFGILPGDLEAARAAPNCLGYSSYLLSVAYEGDFLDFLAAFLPCEWGYVEIGRRLKRGGIPKHKHYAKWIETYASQEFWELIESIKVQLNRLALGVSEDKLNRLKKIFQVSSLWERLFWDMAWDQQSWPQ